MEPSHWLALEAGWLPSVWAEDHHCFSPFVVNDLFLNLARHLVG
jgi:hypothetical protein